MDDTSREFAPGTILAGRYEILERLGMGTFSSVYRARDLELKTDYALKFLKHLDSGNPSEALERFKREALLSQRVAHEDCCRVFDFLEVEGRFILKMELVDGWTLAQVLTRLRPIPLPLAVSLVVQSAGAVATLHRQDVIHRDIKASNLMVTRRGRIKVMDLGISWAPEMSSLTMAGTLLGTPSYMAPELILHQEAYPQTDVYALGSLSYYLLTGRLPFAATDLVRLFMMQVQNDPVSLRHQRPELPIEVDELVLRCLNKDHTKRPKDAVALDEAWRQIFGIRSEPELIREILTRNAEVLSSEEPWLAADPVTSSLADVAAISLEEQTRADRPRPAQVVAPELPRTPASPVVLVQTEAPKPTEPPLPQPKLEPPPSVPAPASGSSAGLWILLAVLAVAGLLVGVWLSR